MHQHQSVKGDGLYVVDAGDMMHLGIDLMTIVLLRDGVYYGAKFEPLVDQTSIKQTLLDSRLKITKVK